LQPETTKGGITALCIQPATERKYYEIIANAALAIDTDIAASQPNIILNLLSASSLVPVSFKLVLLSFLTFILNLLVKYHWNHDT
jgi:hypothetical protein